MFNKKKIIASITAIVLASTFILAGCAQSKPNETTKSAETTKSVETTENTETVSEPEDNIIYSLSVNTPQPAESAAGKLLGETCAKLEEESNGRLKFDVYYSGQLLTVFDTVNGVSSGICDIAFLPTSTNPDFFPINGKLLILPFLGMPADDSIMDVYDKLCEEFPEIEGEVEAQNMRTLSTFFFLREDLYFTGDQKVEALSDLSGKKIAVANSFVGTLINNNGAAPVTVTQGDVYTTVESGVVDGLIHHDAFIRAGGAVELFKAVTMFGDDGIVREMGKFFMNNDSYNNLPSDLQDLIDSEFQALAKAIADADKGVSEGVKGELQNKGCTITELTNEQVKPFEEAAKEVHEQCISNLSSQGIPAQDIYDKLVELCN